MRSVLLVMFLLLSLISNGIAETDASFPVGLDPEDGKYFIVSTVFELATLPKPQDRVSILYKLSNFGHTQIGYGLSLRGFQTSIRPQVYWSAGEGDGGGFYTFGNFDFKARHRYALTLVARPGEFISLYLQEKARKNSNESPKGENLSKVIFLGGHDLKGISTPKNNSPFNYKVSEEIDRTEHAAVLAALVISTANLKDSIDKLVNTLDGAPETLAKTYGADEVKLWEVTSISDPEQ